MEPYIIATTGTKGKTTVTRLLSQILNKAGFKTLRVDTQEVALNERISRKHTRHSSMVLNHFGLAVAPGRFLHLLGMSKQKTVAVLEASLACGVEGTGYKLHDAGVFLNVYSDHLSAKTGLKTPADIAERKSFIFKRIKPGGFAVFNADDPLVVKQLDKCDPGVELIPFGREFKHFNLKSHLRKGGLAVSTSGNWIVLHKEGKTIRLVKASDLPWTFEAKFAPSLMNAMAICGALVAHANGQKPSEKLLNKLQSSQLSDEGGRLQLLTAKNGVKILCDFAHEAVSLGELFGLAKKLSAGKVVGVVRLAPRPPALVRKAAEAVAKLADQAVVYNKYDGEFHKVRADRKLPNEQTTALLAETMEKLGTRANIVVREDMALRAGFSLAKPGDVVVYLVHDDHHRSMKLAQKLAKRRA